MYPPTCSPSTLTRTPAISRPIESRSRLRLLSLFSLVFPLLHPHWMTVFHPPPSPLPLPPPPHPSIRSSKKSFGTPATLLRTPSLGRRRPPPRRRSEHMDRALRSAVQLGYDRPISTSNFHYPKTIRSTDLPVEPITLLFRSGFSNMAFVPLVRGSLFRGRKYTGNGRRCANESDSDLFGKQYSPQRRGSSADVVDGSGATSEEGR